MEKELILMVGLPGSGKSYFVDNGLKPFDYQIASTDDYIEAVAGEHGFTYNEVFKELFQFADKAFWRDINASMMAEQNIIIDRTNLTKKSRGRFITLAKKRGYSVRAYEFIIEDEALWKSRLNRPGKTIPDDVLENMIKTRQECSLDEGIDSIHKVIV